MEKVKKQEKIEREIEVTPEMLEAAYLVCLNYEDVYGNIPSPVVEEIIIAALREQGH